MSSPTLPAARRLPGRRDWLQTHRAQLASASLTLLRLSLALVFLLFGGLKFFPGVSPAADIATRTLTALSFGLIPPAAGLVLVAALETAIGLCLLRRRSAGLGLGLMAFAFVGILSPLVLFPAELFAGPSFAPTLLGQYVIKDLVLVAAAAVLAVETFLQPATTAPARPFAPAQVHPHALHPSLVDSPRPSKRTVAAVLLGLMLLGLVANAALASAVASPPAGDRPVIGRDR